MRTKRQESVKTYQKTWVTEYTCDRCGREISRENHGENYVENYAHELLIGLDGEERVNFYRRRDYCPPCLEPIWEAINQLIHASPGDERDKEYD